MTDNFAKIYPTSTPEVARMLGFHLGDHEETPAADLPVETAAGLPVANLPVTPEKPLAPEKKANGAAAKAEVKPPEILADEKPGVKKIIKAAVPYLLVFAIGLVAYYFFLSDATFNLSGLADKIKPKAIVAPLTAKDTALTQLEKDPKTLQGYKNWIAQFYFDVSDASIADPNADNSGNGLTNFQKFLLGLNPKSYDTLGLGQADSQTILSGINPLTGGQLTEAQKDIVKKYFDQEIINNRLAVESLKRQGSVAGFATGATGNIYQPPINLNPAGQGGNQNVVRLEAPRSNNINARTGTNYNSNNNNNGKNANQFAGFDNPVNPEINTNDLNLNTPGRLEIPALNINVPIIWTKDARNFEKDLQLGVVHYPGTAIPGQIGTTYLSGHSSNYVWAKGDYNKVFSALNDLPDNASFIITVVQNTGKDARFHYVVTRRQEFSPTDPEQFRNAGESVVALSTCWPVGSTKNRLVVFGKLTQVEK